ncbi:MAG: dockerin type I repeat-containing protein [Clostridia bacterium]|nr:dockerin type I repeat-containing protein [Clostridia bacterium]
MKHRMHKALALMLALLLTAAFGSPALSEPEPDYELSEYDREMLLAFWQQPSYDGMTNGEAVYDIVLGENGFLEEPAPEYDGGYWTYLLETPYYYDSDVFFFDLYYYLNGWDGTPIDEEEGKPGMKTTPMVVVRPDLYGPLDLHGTGIGQFNGDDMCVTHIDDIDFDDCSHLYRIRFRNQEFAKTLSAMNCPLSRIDTRGSSFKRLDFTIPRYDEPMHISGVGGGSVSVYYSYPTNGEVSRLTASSREEIFMGWYRDSELISAEPVVEVAEGGNYTARFGGDANGDGVADANDALILFRMCMGLIPPVDTDLDFNCSGAVDAGDALLLFRFAMGLS